MTDECLVHARLALNAGRIEEAQVWLAFHDAEVARWKRTLNAAA